jgi:hypothetical protein
VEYIKIGFSKSKKPLPIGSWIIRAYQRTSYSHVYVEIPTNKFPSNHILHASEGIVHKMSKTQFHKKHEITEEYVIQIPEMILFNKHQNKSTTLHQLILDEMHEISGADYGLMQNIGIVLVDLLRLFNIKIKNPWTSGWNCSEFVGFVLKNIFPEAFKNKNLDIITPKDINNILKSLTNLYK